MGQTPVSRDMATNHPYLLPYCTAGSAKFPGARASCAYKRWEQSDRRGSFPYQSAGTRPPGHIWHMMTSGALECEIKDDTSSHNKTRHNGTGSQYGKCGHAEYGHQAAAPYRETPEESGAPHTTLATRDGPASRTIPCSKDACPKQASTFGHLVSSTESNFAML